jgi:hypothetical protein
MRMEGGRWRVEMEDGGWKMEGGGWSMEDSEEEAA